MIVDTFAGPGGWDEGLRMIGRTDVVGIEWDEAACLTAEAAGHVRERGDIAKLHPALFKPADGLIGSPPCPGFSAAGLGLGRKDFELLLGAIDMIGIGFDVDTVLDNVRAQQHDPRSALTLEPLRWALAIEPEWVALEQVPTVLPLWEAYAVILRAKGYHVWTGNLQAEQYGVPQTRRRAVLMASRRPVGQPAPTHSRYYPRSPERLDEGVQKWVSMAEALGWYDPNRGDWRLRNNSTANAAERTPDQPAPTLYFGARSNYCAWEWRGEGPAKELPEWAFNRPSTTIVGSFKPEIVAAPGYRTTVSRQNAPGSVRVTAQEAGVLQSFRPDYPWQGKQGKQFQQVGNAVPPLLAAHVLTALGAARIPLEATA